MGIKKFKQDKWISNTKMCQNIFGFIIAIFVLEIHLSCLNYCHIFVVPLYYKIAYSESEYLLGMVCLSSMWLE